MKQKDDMTLLESKYTQLYRNHDISHPSNLCRWSLYTLLLYFAVQPFNDTLHRIVLIGSYLDLFWIVVMLAEAFLIVYNRKVFAVDRGATSVRSFELTVVIVWIVYSIISYIIADKTSSAESGSLSAAAYNLRFLLQSIPIFILVIVRGLNRKELNAILFVIVAMTPFSIYLSYQEIGITSVADLTEFADSKQGLYYNSYVPYTTFPLFASLYLTYQTKNIIQRIICICSFSSIAVFIFVNPSRQSVLFVLLCAFILIILTITSTAKNLLLIAVIAAIVTFATIRLGLTDTVVSRFFSAQFVETPRTMYMMRAIGNLDGPWEWLFGNGLNINLGDGVNPHNNYIFSVMRFGLVGMILMFLPFFRAILMLTRMFINHRRQPWFDREYILFGMITMLFVLFHSFFGYPHLDALNGPIVWFGLSIWVVLNREIQSEIYATYMSQYSATRSTSTVIG